MSPALTRVATQERNHILTDFMILLISTSALVQQDVGLCTGVVY